MTIGDKINELVEELSKTQLGFFVAEQVLIRMCEVPDYSIVEVNREPVCDTPGYKNHAKEWQEVIARIEETINKGICEEPIK